MQKKTIYLAVSLDVEEEGLFTGRYAQRFVSVKNTCALKKLDPLLSLGVRPTLFCAHSVLSDPRSCDELTRLKDVFACEIAAHLHYWNTPPLPDQSATELTSVPASNLTPQLFSAKLASVLEAAKNLQAEPLTSFRMGRWDMHHAFWPLLAKAGITCDASVRPLHGACHTDSRPDHFAAPQGAYFIQTPYGSIFEVPLTVTPILSVLPKLLAPMRKGEGILGGLARYLASTTNYWGALALLPVYHPLWAMQLITQLYISRGGNLVSLTWHSSEMQASATPHLPTQAHIEALLLKVQRYVSWLMQHYDVNALPLHEIRNALGPQAPIMQSHEDWAYSS
ncbi:MAG: glycosyl transferase family 1 [Desulfovibrio sp.]|nr:glycosyl transferase family 1 [Desulfovibrio sp.]